MNYQDEPLIRSFLSLLKAGALQSRGIDPL